MSANWVGLVLLSVVVGIGVNLAGVWFILRKIERKIDQPFSLGMLAERRRAELEAEDRGQSESRVIPLRHKQRSS